MSKKFLMEKYNLEKEAARKRSGIEDKARPVDASDLGRDLELDEIMKKYEEYTEANQFDFKPPPGIKRKKPDFSAQDVLCLGGDAGVLGNPRKESRN